MNRFSLGVAAPPESIMLNLFEPFYSYRPPNSYGEEIEVRSVHLQGDHPGKHLHNEYQVNILEDGIGRMWCRRQTVAVKPGTIIVVPPGEMHCLASAAGCRVATIFFSQETLERCRENPSSSSGTPLALSGTAFESHTLEKAILDCIQSASNTDSPLAFESQFARVMRLLLGSVSLPADPTAEDPRIGRMVEECRDYLVAHYADPITLDELASRCGLTSFQLIRAFKQRFGAPPHAFQIQLRLAAARDDIKRGVSICAAALGNGFYDQSHLHRHFRSAIGLTPASYQKMVRR